MITITSSAFQDLGRIPDEYGCNGADVNPPLTLYGVPPNTVSLAIIVSDPDSSSGHFTHWLAFNIDPSVRQIVKNSKPFGAVFGENDFGRSVYGGPCPAYGDHRYEFLVYALDSKLDLVSGAKRSEVERAMEGHIIDQGRLVGLYAKK